jgi:hypothetical protein
MTVVADVSLTPTVLVCVNVVEVVDMIVMVEDVFGGMMVDVDVVVVEAVRVSVGVAAVLVVVFRAVTVYVLVVMRALRPPQSTLVGYLLGPPLNSAPSARGSSLTMRDTFRRFTEFGMDERTGINPGEAAMVVVEVVVENSVVMNVVVLVVTVSSVNVVVLQVVVSNVSVTCGAVVVAVFVITTVVVVVTGLGVTTLDGVLVTHCLAVRVSVPNFVDVGTGDLEVLPSLVVHMLKRVRVLYAPSTGFKFAYNTRSALIFIVAARISCEGIEFTHNAGCT